MVHVTITDNGKTVLDVDTQMISAVVRLERLEQESFNVFQVIEFSEDCTTLDRVNLLTIIDDLKEKILDSNPDIRIGYLLKEMLVKSKTTIDVSEMMRQALEREEGG